jgi:hypothetical protein
MIVPLLLLASIFLSTGSAENLKTPNAYKYIPVESFKASAGEVIFRVKARNDAHVALSLDKTHGGEKYEIVIGGWGNKQSVIRNANQGSNLVTSGGAVLDASQHKKFRISWDQSTIKVDREVNGKWLDYMVLKGRDKPPHDKYNWDFKYMMVSTGWGSTGDWEIEKQEYCREGRTLLEVSIKAGNNGEETTLGLKRRVSAADGWAKRKSFYQHGFQSNVTTPISHCIDMKKCYKLAIKDKGGNGMEGGEYKIHLDGRLVVESDFKDGSKETHTFGCQR